MSKLRYCPNLVTRLEEDQVFVFGSNLDGFHGAGAAGLAMRGTPQNNWREDREFLDALRSPLESPKRKGRWAVLGIGEGPQKGHYGESYAIPTVVRPGSRRSIPLSTILKSLKELGAHARENPKKIFLCTISGGGYSGWTHREMKRIFKQWCVEDPPPKNVLLKTSYDFRRRRESER